MVCTVAGRRESRSFLADVLVGALAHLREAARVGLSAAFAAACLFSLALPLPLGGVRLATAGLARRAWGFASQAAWGDLAAQLLASSASLPGLPEASATPIATVPAILLEGAPSTETAQIAGNVWTWSCLALAAWRGAHAGR